MEHSIHLLQKATATLLNFVKDKKKHSLLKTIGSLFENQARVREALLLIKKYKPLVKRLKVGTLEEQELAAQMEKVIADYNQWSVRNKNRLRPIPFSTFKLHHFEQTYKPIQNEELRLMRRVSVTNLPKHILPKYQIGINAFEPLPGEVIIFTDSSHFIDSKQTGFPDPALIPCALSEVFLPQDFHLLQKKEEIAEGLLPKGKFNAKAKLLYALQKERSISLVEEYKAINQVFENLYDYVHLGESLSTKSLLTSPLSRELFAELVSKPLTTLHRIACFQQLFFYKLLCMKLDRDVLDREMDSYFKKLESLKVSEDETVLQEVYEEQGFLNELF